MFNLPLVSLRSQVQTECTPTLQCDTCVKTSNSTGKYAAMEVLLTSYGKPHNMRHRCQVSHAFSARVMLLQVGTPSATEILIKVDLFSLWSTFLHKRWASQTTESSCSLWLSCSEEVAPTSSMYLCGECMCAGESYSADTDSIAAATLRPS